MTNSILNIILSIISYKSVRWQKHSKNTKESHIYSNIVYITKAGLDTSDKAESKAESKAATGGVLWKIVFFSFNIYNSSVKFDGNTVAK